LDAENKFLFSLSAAFLFDPLLGRCRSFLLPGPVTIFLVDCLFGLLFYLFDQEFYRQIVMFVYRSLLSFPPFLFSVSLFLLPPN